MNTVNINQLHQAVTLSLQKRVTEASTAHAAMLLQDFTQTQANINEAAAPHPSLGKAIDITA